MDKLNFYHQKRRDGGIRTGVEFNNERVLERYDPGDSPQDSALLWFVDVRCSGENLPSEPESVRHWFLERADLIQSTLNELSEQLIAGIDSDWPMRKPIQTRDDVRMAIYCSATRRLSGREISEILSELAKTWSSIVHNLGSYADSISANG